ncbi:MAG: FG-GAP repeat protein, partial [Chloroflexi bacterium]|nr:FG-GAP repeat protein [Chloroflexota bacterium]
AVSGNTAVVGARWEDTGGNDAGAAYVFQRDEGGPGNWGEVTKLTASDAQAVDNFGSSVAIDFGIVVVGAPGVPIVSTTTGAAYVFEPAPVPTITPTPLPDKDGDTLPDAVESNTGVFVSLTDTGTDPNNPDTDGDGCSDGEELAPKSEAARGGGRNPLYFWDFFDPTGNGAVGFTDFLALLLRNGAVGDPNIDPLSEPPPPPAYHPRFDRGGQIPGGNLWEERPANGSIGFTDFLSLVRQQRATCILPL